MRNRKHDGNKSSVVNFGVQGWVTILYCLDRKSTRLNSSH